jgi:YD repeat-containing protein
LVIDGPLAGAGDAVTYTYNSTGDLLSVTNSPGHVTRYEQYDGMGRVGRVVDPNGAVRETEYDARGRVTAERLRADGQVAETRHEHNAAGLLAATSTPDGNRRQFHYDVAGRLQAEFEQANDGRFDVRHVWYNPESQVAGVKVERTDLHPFPVPAAQFLGQSVPAAMLGGTAYSISVQLRNTGNVPWRVQDGDRLRSANSETWGFPNGVPLGHDVAPGEVANFVFGATAPRVTTPLTFQWQMTKGDGTAFGEPTAAVAIPPPVAYRAELVSHDVPAHVFHGQTSWISVRVRNTGSHPWNLAPDPTVVLAQNNAQHPMPPRTYASGVIHPGQVATLTYGFNPPPGSKYHDFGGVVWMENVQALLEIPVKSMYVEDVTRRPCGAGVCEQPR